MAGRRGGFRRDPSSGGLVHQPTRYPLDRRGTGSGGTPGPPGPPGPPGSDDITGSNINARGIGVFDNKTGGDLQFRGIDDPSNRILVTLDAPDATIDLDIDEDALTTLAHLHLANIFTATNRFQAGTTFDQWLDIDQITTPTAPTAAKHRIFSRQNGSNFELVSLDYLGNECVLCSHAVAADTNLPIMWVDVP